MNSTPITTSKRMPWLDACRGLAMIFVVYSHVDLKTTGIISFITPIMIPLFFAITGYLFNVEQKTPRVFFRKMLHRLILPWLFFAYIQYVPGRLLLFGRVNLLETTWDIISGHTLWYMPCCIISESLFYLINRTVRSFKWRIVICCACFGIGYTLVSFDLGFLFALNVVFISQLYLLLGQTLRRYESKPNTLPTLRKHTLIFMLIIAYLAMSTANTLIYPNSHLNQRLNVYNCLPLTLTMIFVGCIMIFMLFQSIPVPRWLCFIGRNTLVIYVLHDRFLWLFKYLYNALNLPSGNVVFISVIITALICCCTAMCALLVNRYLPFLNGRRNQA